MKMKTEHVLPLPRQAIAMLGELKELSGGSHFVLPDRNRDKPISNNTMLFALYRLGYKGKMTGHGFRAVASTILNETGFKPDVIERQLAQRFSTLARNHGVTWSTITRKNCPKGSIGDSPYALDVASVTINSPANPDCQRLQELPSITLCFPMPITAAGS